MAIIVFIHDTSYGINIHPEASDYAVHTKLSPSKLLNLLLKNDKKKELTEESIKIIQHWSKAHDVHWKASSASDGYGIRKEFSSPDELITVAKQVAKARSLLKAEEALAYQTIEYFCGGEYDDLIDFLVKRIIETFSDSSEIKKTFGQQWFGEIAHVDWSSPDTIKSAFEERNLETLYRLVATLININRPIKGCCPLGPTPCSKHRADKGFPSPQRRQGTLALIESHPIFKQRRSKHRPILAGNSGTTMDILHTTSTLGISKLSDFIAITKFIQSFYHIAPKHFPGHTAIEISYAFGVMMEHFKLVKCSEQACEDVYQLLITSEDAAACSKPGTVEETHIPPVKPKSSS